MPRHSEQGKSDAWEHCDTWILSTSILTVEKEGEKPVSFSMSSPLSLHGPMFQQGLPNSSVNVPAQLHHRDVRLSDLWFLVCASLEIASSNTLLTSRI